MDQRAPPDARLPAPNAYRVLQCPMLETPTDLLGFPEDDAVAAKGSTTSARADVMRIHPDRTAARDDVDALRAIARGVMDPLGALYHRHHREVRAFIARAVRNQDEVSDLVQLTFLDVPSAASRFDDRRSVRSWLVGLARIIIMRHRRETGRRAHRLAAWSIDPSLLPEPPADALELRDSAGRAFAALQTLPEPKRRVFIMMALHELPGDEVARSLGVPIGTVWTRMYHARRELRALLDGGAG